MSVQCAICSRGLDQPGVPPVGNNRETRICTISCGHIFHVNCLNEWWKQLIHSSLSNVIHYTCPVCRYIQLVPTVFQVFPSFFEAGTGDDELRNETQVLRDTVRTQGAVIRRLRGNLFKVKFKPCAYHKENIMARSRSAPR